MSEQEVQGPAGFTTGLVLSQCQCQGVLEDLCRFPGIFMDSDLHMRNGSSGVHTWGQSQMYWGGRVEVERRPYNVLCQVPIEGRATKQDLKTSYPGTHVALFPWPPQSKGQGQSAFSLGWGILRNHIRMYPSRLCALVENDHGIGAGMKPALEDPPGQQEQP